MLHSQLRDLVGAHPSAALVAGVHIAMSPTYVRALHNEGIPV